MGGCVCGSGEDDMGKLFASTFIRKEKVPLTNRRISKSDAGQEIWIGNHESSDVRKVKVPSFSVGKCRTNSGRDGGRRIIQRQPPSGDWGGKA